MLTPDSPPVAPAVANSLQGFSSIAEYNLQQLASLAEKADMVEPVVSIHNHATANPSSAPSPTPSFTLADLFTGDINTANTAYHNLQALAKLGLNTTGKFKRRNVTCNYTLYWSVAPDSINDKKNTMNEKK